MDDFFAQYAPILAITFAFSMAAVLVLWLASIPLRDVSIIDMFFAVIMLGIAGIAYALGDGAAIRKRLILLLVGLWALRITVHLVRRNWGKGEDPRYTKLRDWVSGDRAFYWLSLRKVFLLQGVVIWVATLPVQVAQIYPAPATLGWPALLGSLLWAFGLVFETVADHQLTNFRADPANSGKVLDSGLWKYSRHPNYFGELCVWWGLFLVACDNAVGLLTIVGPLVYTYLIVNVTGQKTLDKKLARERPGYRAYMERTSGIIPIRPRLRRS